MLLSLQAVFLVSALCLDSFAASFAFGAERIRIPPLSVAVISGMCSLVLAVSLFFGAALRPYIPHALSSGISFAILALLGLFRLLDSGIKNLIRKSQSGRAQIKFKFLSFDFILRIYADSTEADCDHSKVLAPLEAAPLSLALSIDGLAAGVGAGIMGLHYLPVILLSFFIGALMVSGGSYLGRHIAARHEELNLSWVSGLVLLGLAFMRLL